MSNAWKRNLAGLVASVALIASAASAQTAICYNCPPEWADWATQIRLIKEKTGVTVPPDNKNSGQALAQLVAEKASPVTIDALGQTSVTVGAAVGVAFLRPSPVADA
jgi:putative spermidine/putrescine transport system substrate-binding protein